MGWTWGIDEIHFYPEDLDVQFLGCLQEGLSVWTEAQVTLSYNDLQVGAALGEDR